MSDVIYQRTVARKRWFPSRSYWWGLGLAVPPPRLVQLLKLGRCRLQGHRWNRWRVETLDWFEYVDTPEPYAWRTCARGCGTIERVLPPECPVCHQRYVVCDDCGPRPEGEW